MKFVCLIIIFDPLELPHLILLVLTRLRFIYRRSLIIRRRTPPIRETMMVEVGVLGGDIKVDMDKDATTTTNMSNIENQHHHLLDKTTTKKSFATNVALLVILL